MLRCPSVAVAFGGETFGGDRGGGGLGWEIFWGEGCGGKALGRGALMAGFGGVGFGGEYSRGDLGGGCLRGILVEGVCTGDYVGGSLGGEFRGRSWRGGLAVGFFWGGGSRCGLGGEDFTEGRGLGGGGGALGARRSGEVFGQVFWGAGGPFGGSRTPCCDAHMPETTRYGDWQGSNATRCVYRVWCSLGHTSRGPSTGAHPCTMHVGDPQLPGSHHALGLQPPRYELAYAEPHGMAQPGGLASTTTSQALQTHCAPLPAHQQLACSGTTHTKVRGTVHSKSHDLLSLPGTIKYPGQQHRLHLCCQLLCLT